MISEESTIKCQIEGEEDVQGLNNGREMCGGLRSMPVLVAPGMLAPATVGCSGGTFLGVRTTTKKGHPFLSVDHDLLKEHSNSVQYLSLKPGLSICVTVILCPYFSATT
jgi:hypothetical protein